MSFITSEEFAEELCKVLSLPNAGLISHIEIDVTAGCVPAVHVTHYLTREQAGKVVTLIKLCKDRNKVD